MGDALDLERCAADLGQSELFADIAHEQLLVIAQLCELITLERGEYLTHEGEEAHWFYILIEGRVSISMRLRLPHLERTDTQERTLTLIDAASRPVLGETALVGQTIRAATVRCATDCMLYRLDATDLLGLMQLDPATGYFIFRRLSERLYHRLSGANTDVVKLSAALVYALEERPVN